MTRRSLPQRNPVGPTLPRADRTIRRSWLAGIRQALACRDVSPPAEAWPRPNYYPDRKEKSARPPGPVSASEASRPLLAIRFRAWLPSRNAQGTDKSRWNFGFQQHHLHIAQGLAIALTQCAVTNGIRRRPDLRGACAHGRVNLEPLAQFPQELPSFLTFRKLVIEREREIQNCFALRARTLANTKDRRLPLGKQRLKETDASAGQVSYGKRSAEEVTCGQVVLEIRFGLSLHAARNLVDGLLVGLANHRDDQALSSIESPSDVNLTVSSDTARIVDGVKFRVLIEEVSGFPDDRRLGAPRRKTQFFQARGKVGDPAD